MACDLSFKIWFLYCNKKNFGDFSFNDMFGGHNHVSTEIMLALVEPEVSC